MKDWVKLLPLLWNMQLEIGELLRWLKSWEIKKCLIYFLKGVNITSIILTRLFGLSDLKVLMGHGLLHMIRSFQYMEDMAFLVRVRVGNILFMFLNARLI